ncbi:sigma-70 family RNA polymerase sigma factor [Alteromonas sp. M12]|uniref:sigma-70 family RNA polymerase sigma factor n=1 Tax=Alteromonas sp. M12 TaxID=3135644 RepID=UPI00319EB9C0
MHLPKKSSSHLHNTSSSFLELFEAERKRIYAYIYALVLNKAAADDIFQETSTILWQEFDKFEIGSSFSKWANAIVFNCVRTYRRQNKKFVVGISDELFDQLIENVESNTLEESKWHMLQKCISQLTGSAHQIFYGFYVENMSAQAIADKTGRSIYGIRKTIHLLRKKLFDCVDQNKKGASS